MTMPCDCMHAGMFVAICLCMHFLTSFYFCIRWIFRLRSENVYYLLSADYGGGGGGGGKEKSSMSYT